MNKLELLLQAHGIDLAILKDPNVQMMVDEGEGVDSMRYIERKSGVSFSTMDKLAMVEALETYQFVKPTRDSIMNAAGKSGAV